MHLLQRIASLIAENLHELLDQYEDPQTSLERVVREMETAIEEALGEAARAIADERLLERQLDALRRRNRAHHEAAERRLAEQLTAARELSSRMRAQLETMFARLFEVRRRLKSLTVRRRTALRERRLVLQSVGDADIAHRFERLCEWADYYECEADAMIELCLRAGRESVREQSDIL